MFFINQTSTASLQVLFARLSLLSCQLSSTFPSLVLTQLASILHIISTPVKAVKPTAFVPNSDNCLPFPKSCLPAQWHSV